jgi:small subunit ribosomal protein S21
MYGVTDSKGGTENIERMLRRFKRVTESAGILAEIKKRRSYEKPSEKKRRAKKDAIRRVMLEKLPPRKNKRKDRDDGRRSHQDY